MTPWHIALAGGATATCRPRSPGARFFVCVFLEMRTLGEVVAASAAKILHGRRCTTYTASARRTSTAHRSRNVNRPISHDLSWILLSVARAWHGGCCEASGVAMGPVVLPLGLRVAD